MANSDANRPFLINYVGEFILNDSFTYFVTSQRHDLDINKPADNRYHSKLNRVCHDADNFDAFTEITIECQGNDGDSYNLVQAAYLGEAGSALAESVGVDPGEDVLYAVFARSINEEGDEPSNRSALCVFKLDAIEQAFIDAIVECFMVRDSKNEIMYLQDGDCTGTNVSVST